VSRKLPQRDIAWWRDVRKLWETPPAPDETPAGEVPLDDELEGLAYTQEAPDEV
jgi:hypothetical protein